MLLVLLGWLAAWPVWGEVKTDGSLGAFQTLVGPNIDIAESLGRARGGNLFHSLEKLDLAAGDIATFRGAGFTNIFTRVTGGRSSIDGTLRSEAPNFYLLNKDGVLFGPTAEIDVTGSFAVVASGGIDFADGTRFAATPNPATDALLSTAAPVAFGFLTGTSGTITLDGTPLTGAPGQTVALAAATVELTNGAKVSSTGSVVIRGGKLTMLGSSKIVVEASLPGDKASVKMTESLTLSVASSITGTALADLGAEPVVDVAAPSVSLLGDATAALNPSIVSGGNGVDPAGSIRVEAEELKVLDGGVIGAAATGAGAGGDLQILARNVVVSGPASKLSSENPFGSTGVGGSLRLDATGDVTASDGGLITTTTSDSGAAGNLQLRIGGRLTVARGGQVTADTFGPGTGGNISVRAGSLVVAGNDLGGFTGISAEAQGSGRGGNVHLDIPGPITITSDGRITAATFGDAPGGNVEIHAASLRISRQGAVQFSGVNTSSYLGAGASGDLRLDVSGALTLVEGGQIAARTFSSGAGGTLQVNAGSVAISGTGSSISAQTTGDVLGGAGGNIRLRTDLLEVRNRGEISASTSGVGAGGSIDILARQVELDGGRIAAETTSTGFAPIPATVSDLEVTFTILHPHAGNLTLTLVSPTLQGLELFSGVGGTGQNFTDTTLADNAPTAISAGVAPFTGRFRPVNPLGMTLADFNGVGFNGVWQLVLTDPDLTDVGELTSWSLTSGGVTVNADPQFLPVPFPDAFGTENVAGFLIVDVPPAGFTPIQPGRGGNVRIAAETMTLLREGSVSAQTLNSAQGGDVQLQIGGVLRIADRGFVSANTLLSGPGGNLDIAAKTVRVESGGAITAGTAGTGRGGNINLRGNSVAISGHDLTDPSTISAESTSSGLGGRGGDIFVNADKLSITGTPGLDVGISARSLGGGTSGSIWLQGGALSLQAGAVVASSNTGDGNAGSVTVGTSKAIRLDGASVITTAAARGEAGLIRLDAGTRIDLTRGSRITASAGRNGGSIQLRSRDVLQLIDSEISATAGTVLAATTGGAGGSGGNISIVGPEFTILEQSLISANAAIGRGGNIEISTDFFFNSSTLITATGAVAGTITISAPELDLAAGLVELANSLIDQSSLLREQCARRLNDDFSSFLLLGRGGISFTPEDAQAESGAAGRRRKGKADGQ